MKHLGSFALNFLSIVDPGHWCHGFFWAWLWAMRTAVRMAPEFDSFHNERWNQTNMWVCLKIGYIPNYSHLIGIMISKTIGFRGTLFSDTPMWPKLVRYKSPKLVDSWLWTFDSWQNHVCRSHSISPTFLGTPKFWFFVKMSGNTWVWERTSHSFGKKWKWVKVYFISLYISNTKPSPSHHHFYGWYNHPQLVGLWHWVIPHYYPAVAWRVAKVSYGGLKQHFSVESQALTGSLGKMTFGNRHFVDRWGSPHSSCKMFGYCRLLIGMSSNFHIII
jgi:hypothetical protein